MFVRFYFLKWIEKFRFPQNEQGAIVHFFRYLSGRYGAFDLERICRNEQLCSWNTSAGEKNLVADKAIEIIPPPEKVILPLLQNVGAPCEPVVRPKQDVSFGDPVCRGGASVSASLHSPVSGRIQKISVTTLANGRHVKAIFIKTEGEQLSGRALWEEIFGGDWPMQNIQKYDPQEIIAAIYSAGIVGQGGAAFPTHVKLMPGKKKPSIRF